MPRKLVLECEDNLWKRVLMYKIKNEYKNNNETVVKLIKKGLAKK